jgi:Zn-dependent protease with chaperone function
VSVWQLVVAVLGHHVIPCILACGVIGVALWLLFGPLRLRRAAHRVLFLYVALLKGGLALLAGVGACCLTGESPVFFIIGFRLPDLVPDGFALEPLASAAVFSGSRLWTWITLALLSFGGALLLYRWFRLAPLHRSVYLGYVVQTGDADRVSHVFEALVERLYSGRNLLPRPRLLVVRGLPCSAFTMGLRPPVVVVSAELVEHLGDRELAGVLAHELGHVRRLDYVGRWLATILHDVMIWNPFALLWYRQLVDEQERAADEYAAEALGDPLGVASGLVEVAACVRGLPSASIGLLTAYRGTGDEGRLEERVDRLVASASGSTVSRGHHPAIVALSLAGFFAAQPYVIVSLPDLLRLVS